MCSGEFHAADVRINGTNTTMAQIIQKVGALESRIRELKELRVRYTTPLWVR